MSHFRGESRCVLMFGEVIRSERMPKAVIRPGRETDGTPERFHVGVIISLLKNKANTSAVIGCPSNTA
jgi:hypothetical protein